MKKINFQPFGHNVLIEKPIIEEKTKAGVIKSSKQIQEELENLPQFLEVLAVGTSVTEIIVGDKVLIRPGKYNTLKLEDKEYLLLSQGFIEGKEL